MKHEGDQSTCAKCVDWYEKDTIRYSQFLKEIALVKEVVKNSTVEGFPVDDYIKRSLDGLGGKSILNLVNEERTSEVVNFFRALDEGVFI